MGENQESDKKGDLYFDENTLRKVYDAMALAGIPSGLRQDAVTNMQNAGILFRERGRL